MGHDKALMPLDGIPLAVRVQRVLREAGACEVFAIGGDAKALTTLGFVAVPDERPLEGPLGGILTALSVATEETVVVVACDMPWIESQHVTKLVASLDDAEVVFSAANGRVEPLLSAWTRASRRRLYERFAAGERSPLRAARHISLSVLELGEGSWSLDLDTPNDLAIASTRRHQR